MLLFILMKEKKWRNKGEFSYHQILPITMSTFWPRFRSHTEEKMWTWASSVSHRYYWWRRRNFGKEISLIFGQPKREMKFSKKYWTPSMWEVILLSKLRQAAQLERDVEVILHNYCCPGKAISITCSECLSVALVIQHAKRMRSNKAHALCGLQYFSRLYYKRQEIQKKKLLNIKFVFWISLQNFA